MSMSFWELFVIVDEEEKRLLKRAGVPEEKFRNIGSKYGVTLYLQETKLLFEHRKNKQKKEVL